MNALKAGLVGFAAVVVSIVTLRTVRKHRSNPQDETVALADSEAAAEHAVAAAGHARAAGGKAIEYVADEIKASRSDAGSASEATVLPEPARRLRRIGKGWVRR